MFEKVRNFFEGLIPFYDSLGNSSKDYVLTVAAFLVILLCLKLIQKSVIGRLKQLAKRTKTDFDDVLVDILKGLKPPFYFIVSLYFSLRFLSLSGTLNKIIDAVFLVVVVYEIIQALKKLVKYLAFKALAKGDNDTQAISTVKTLNVFIQIILWSVGLLLILSNLGVNITSLIAGLGIGGIAIAFALQNILGDVFSSFAILIDKPFQVGDFIKIGDDMGVVEKIGIKTSRLRTLNGQLLVVSNQELTSTRVENFQQMKKRRGLFTLGVIYETEVDKLRAIPSIIKEIVNAQEKTDFDRCNFITFGDFSLNFETSFYVETDSYNDFLDTFERINLEIFSAFKEKGIEFAYPTHLEYQKKAE
ncbi:MAG: mechanosensitive ion channel family protein [Patescibacteria group bacterium]|jgi:small-conductance mechanosensitive channel|nr:mechanosensitive ion channel family protein [Patescibacteria group bacterium]